MKPRPTARLAVLAALLLFAALGAAPPAGTLDELAGRLDRRLGLALAAYEGTGRPLARADLALVVRGSPGVKAALVGVVRRLLSARVSGRALRSKAVWAPSPAEQAVARAGREGVELLLDVTVAMVDGYLHLRGELKATDRLLWRDMRQRRRGSLSHLHASVRADAEVRAYQGTLKPARGGLSEQRWRLGHRPVLALAAGDLDRDGRAELALLYPDALVVMARRAGAGPKRLASVKLEQPLARQGSRRPIGALAIVDLDGDGRAEIVGRSSRLAGCFAFDFNGKRLVRRPLPPALAGDVYPLHASGAGGPLRLLTAAAEAGADVFVAPGSPASPASEPRPRPAFPSRFYGLRLARIVEPAQGRREFGAVVDTSGRLLLFSGPAKKLPLTGPPLAIVSGVGVAFDLVDLDDDGALDVVTTEASEPDAEDGVAILRMTANKGLALRWRGGKLPGRVLALTHGDLDGNGKRELLAVLAEHGRGRTWLLSYE